MKYLPTENITYKTRLTEDEVLKRLEALIEPSTKFGLLGGMVSKNYEGQITPPSFAIKRIIRYQNSFLPRITGTLEFDHGGTRIHVKMRLPPVVAVFMGIWFVGVVLACIVVLSYGSGGSAFGLIPFGMLFFGYALTMIAFKFESNNSKKELQRIFEAEIVER